MTNISVTGAIADPKKCFIIYCSSEINLMKELENALAPSETDLYCWKVATQPILIIAVV